MQGTKKQVEFAREIIKESVRRFQEAAYDTGSDAWKLNEAAAFALINVYEWGIPASLIIESGKSFNPAMKGFLGSSEVNKWLDDEALTPQTFYDKVWDYVDCLPAGFGELVESIMSVRNTKIDKTLPLNQFRTAQAQRDAKLKGLTQAAWGMLLQKGFKLYKRAGNAAYESGHSDFIDHSEDYLFWGIESPDGREFPGDVSQFEGIYDALNHALLLEVQT